MGKLGIVGLGGQTAFLRMKSFPCPGETVHCQSLFFELGGKGFNQAMAAARLETETVFIGAVGDDVNGISCRKKLEKEGIAAVLIKKDAPTAFGVVSRDENGENIVEVYPGAALELNGGDLRKQEILSELTACDMLLLQNELSKSSLKEAIRIANENEIPVIMNPAPADQECLELAKKCYVITPNFNEAKMLLGLTLSEQISDAGIAEMFWNYGIRRVVVTDGSKGSLVIEEGKCSRVKAVHIGTVTDTTGAGDVFNGALASRLIQGAALIEAAAYASAAAGIAVTRKGAAESAPYKDEVERVQRDFFS